MNDRDRLRDRFTHLHIAALNRLVAEVLALDLPHLEVPDWRDGPPDFSAAEKPDTLESAIELGLKWEEYATELHSKLEQYAALIPSLTKTASEAREALIVFDDYNPPVGG